MSWGLDSSRGSAKLFPTPEQWTLSADSAPTGDGVVAQVVLSDGKKGDYQSISWGWGLGVMLGVYTGGISGAHLNPAVTFANCVYRKFPWRKFPVYMVSPSIPEEDAIALLYVNTSTSAIALPWSCGFNFLCSPRPLTSRLPLD